MLHPILVVPPLELLAQPRHPLSVLPRDRLDVGALPRSLDLVVELLLLGGDINNGAEVGFGEDGEKGDGGREGGEEVEIGLGELVGECEEGDDKGGWGRRTVGKVVC